LILCKNIDPDIISFICQRFTLKNIWGRRGHDRMLVGFTTTYAISVCCEFESRSGRGVQHYVIKFVSILLILYISIFILSINNSIDVTICLPLFNDNEVCDKNPVL
jgi:hypothetical protein